MSSLVVTAQVQTYQNANIYPQVSYIDGLMQERRNSSALAMGLRLSWIKPSNLVFSYTPDSNLPNGSSAVITRSNLSRHLRAKTVVESESDFKIIWVKTGRVITASRCINL